MILKVFSLIIDNASGEIKELPLRPLINIKYVMTVMAMLPPHTEPKYLSDLLYLKLKCNLDMYWIKAPTMRPQTPKEGCPR